MEAFLLWTNWDTHVYSFFEWEESFLQAFNWSKSMVENQVNELCKNLSFKKYKDILEFEEKLRIKNEKKWFANENHSHILTI